MSGEFELDERGRVRALEGKTLEFKRDLSSPTKPLDRRSPSFGFLRSPSTSPYTPRQPSSPRSSSFVCATSSNPGPSARCNAFPVAGES